MKATILIKTIATSALVIAVATIIATPMRSAAEDMVKGGQKQLQLNQSAKTTKGVPITSTADLESVKSGDQIVMSCPKCKNVTVTTVSIGGRGAFSKTSTSVQHLCPGCKTKLETTGHGKAKMDKIVHSCSDCGSTDAYCCVVKKGGDPTKGMDK
ncbi:MAG TPA: hypothetical protein PKA41_16270 [Verrucomicrobiota bacterium]|nr:hypothetical protein [Verrucomicrobiota bacterium]